MQLIRYAIVIFGLLLCLMMLIVLIPVLIASIAGILLLAYLITLWDKVR